MTELGRLQRVDLRTIWLSEPQGFTPWLAREDNLALLGETIGIDLELEAQERNVGPFRADILCKNTLDGSWVLIENQLERTDHLHLGQLLTYAAGLEAVTIVWLARQFTEEHRATLDWLNRITGEPFRFFGIEVELWRIGTSPPAPRFNVIAKPNDWSQAVGEAARTIASGADGAEREEYQRYWQTFQTFLASRRSGIRLASARAWHGVNFGLGRTGFNLAALGGWRDKWIKVALYIRGVPGKAYFHLLAADKAEIERELGFSVDWLELPGQQRSRIEDVKRGVDPADEADWLAQHTWLADKLEIFDRVFRPRVKALDASSWAAPGTDETLEQASDV